MTTEKTPRQIVEELNKYIVGQYDAKKAVALALRSRWRRLQLEDEQRAEIYPKNILMIGPTGVGKTEIARRLAKMTDAPFVKVEASKFTEVGYVGRDVESMIRDLVEVAINQMRSRRQEEVQQEAERAVEEHLLNLLLPAPPHIYPTISEVSGANEPGSSHLAATREKLRQMLIQGELEDREVEIDLPERSVLVQGFIPGAGMEEIQSNLQEMLDKMVPTRKKKQTMRIRDARPHLLEEETGRLIDEDALVEHALQRVEESGIVFLDELDKIIGGGGGGNGPDVSREGVQRDILPLVEGSTVKTKYGMVNSDHILFIGAGAFYGSSPSDLIPELQGRFPIRVELDSLGKDEFVQILKEPENSLTKQYKALLETEGVLLEFEDGAVETMAEMAAEINDKTDNIGARRLHTIIEKVLEEISFLCPETPGKKYVITADVVQERLSEIVKDQDLSRYIL